MKTYQDVQRMIRDGATTEEIETVLTDDRTPLTDAQIASLRADMAAQIDISLEMVRSDMGDGGWSLHAHRTDIDESEDSVAAWPIVASGEATWLDDDGDWDRPNESDYAAALEAARALALRMPLAVSS